MKDVVPAPRVTVLLAAKAIAKTWGELTAKGRRAGKTISTADGLIAASAISHGLHVMTENVKDFEATGARIINPY